MPGSTVPWDLALLLIVLAVIVPWRGQRRMEELLARPRLQPADRLVIYASTIAFQWLAAGLILWRCLARGWSLPRLGVSSANLPADIALGTAIALVLATMQLVSFRHLSRLPPERRGRVYEIARRLMPQSFVEVLPFFALVSTVSICEEFLYRGFAFGLLETLSFAPALMAVLGSSVLFALAHLYQGRQGVASAFFVGLLFALVRARTSSIIPAVIAHWVVDLVAGLAAPRAFWDAAPRKEADEENVGPRTDRP